jgi:hypothetical protein
MAQTQTKKPLKFDSTLVKLQVNHKTWIYVKPDLPEKEIERIELENKPDDKLL